MMSKKDILAAMARFEADKSKVVSIRLLCDLAGITTVTYAKARDEEAMSEMVQIRLERALTAVERGEVKVMQDAFGRRSITYRRRPEPEFKRSLGLTMKGGRIGIKTGMRNANCYTAPTFREELDGRS